MNKINSKIHIFTDFDGTITKHDSLELILDHFTGTEWRKIEEQVTLGRLSEKTSLQAEFNLMNEKLEEVLNYIDENVQIDSTFKDFIDYCHNNKFNLTILSGGIDIIIERVLKKFKFNEIPFYCNSINISNISDKENKKKWTVIPNSLPKIKNNCNHCKTYHLEQARKAGMKVIYIGDGNT
ncbi:MAG: MtnX-like HAD-IB family phosphatase, partial [Calditrichia bacterium]|nr:MtnX-like HAD-IB family phosphatase [Calditrichia bacterium]